MNRTRHPGKQEAATIGGRLRRLRKQKGLTQTELACQIGIQQSDLSRMENGEYRVSLDNLFRLLAVLNVAVSEFFADERPAPQPAATALSQTDMQLLHMLRELSSDAREEVHEFVEFKVRRERAERRSRESTREQEHGS